MGQWIAGAEIVLEDWQRVMVGEYQGICHYQPEKIVFRTKQGQVLVQGKNLVLDSLGPQGLIIGGDIHSLALEDTSHEK